MITMLLKRLAGRPVVLTQLERVSATAIILSVELAMEAEQTVEVLRVNQQETRRARETSKQKLIAARK